MLNVKGSYLYEDDRPFFWLGDTAWLLCENLEFDDIKLYLRNRYELGFNVIQVVLFYTLPSKEGIESGMPVKCKDTYSKEYFKLVNDTIKYAKDLQMYIALLPCWGSFVKKDVLKIQDIDYFTTFLVNEFSSNDNLIWVIGGDIKGDVNQELYNKFGYSLKEKDKKHLITFHPFGRTISSRWFNECSWLDFNMFQSGHRRYDQNKLNRWDDVEERNYGEDSWRYVVENNSCKTVKPCLDAEPSYEGIVQGLHNLNEPYWEARDVRRYMYFSVFEGACGFTYGNNAIIQFYTKELGVGAYGVRETWFEALSDEGGGELQFLKNLMESVDFCNGKPRSDLLLIPQKERYHRISIFAGKDFLFAYNYMGDSYTISLKEFKDRDIDCYWMNPINGSLNYFKTIKNEDELTVRPSARHELSNDWVLVLKMK